MYHHTEDSVFSLTNSKNKVDCHFPGEIKIVTFKFILLRDVHHAMYDTHRENDILRQYNDKSIMCSDRACGIILLSVTASRR